MVVALDRLAAQSLISLFGNIDEIKVVKIVPLDQQYVSSDLINSKFSTVSKKKQTGFIVLHVTCILKTGHFS